SGPPDTLRITFSSAVAERQKFQRFLFLGVTAVILDSRGCPPTRISIKRPAPGFQEAANLQVCPTRPALFKYNWFLASCWHAIPAVVRPESPIPECDHPEGCAGSLFI